MDKRTQLIQTLLYIWQLPQHLVALLLLLVLKPEKREVQGVTFYVSDKMKGGISLGRYIIVGPHYNEKDIAHEDGHSLQSLMLGWAYLLVVGIPSLAWATLYGRVIPETPGGYYRFFTERWADRLGNVRR